MDIYRILVIIGTALALCAAFVAFLVTWHGYYRHHIRGGPLFTESSHRGLLTLAFFVVLSVALIFVLTLLKI